jgi:hypothetical protein
VEKSSLHEQMLWVGRWGGGSLWKFSSLNCLLFSLMLEVRSSAESEESGGQGESVVKE